MGGGRAGKKGTLTSAQPWGSHVLVLLEVNSRALWWRGRRRGRRRRQQRQRDSIPQPLESHAAMGRDGPLGLLLYGRIEQVGAGHREMEKGLCRWGDCRVQSFWVTAENLNPVFLCNGRKYCQSKCPNHINASIAPKCCCI